MTNAPAPVDTQAHSGLGLRSSRLQAGRFSPLLRNFSAIVIFYCIVIASAELLTTYVNPIAGALVHIGLLLALSFHAAIISDVPGHELLIGLLLVPIIRLVSLSMPLYLLDQVYWYFAVSIPTFMAVLATMRVLRYSGRSTGLQWRWRQFPLHLTIILISIPLGFVEYLILRPTSMIPVITPGNVTIAILALFIGTGLLEELVFRGLVQQTAEMQLGRWRSIFYAAVVFALMHIGWQSAVDLVFVFLAGIIWGYAFARTRSIVSITLSHTLTNVFVFIVFPLLLNNSSLLPMTTLSSTLPAPPGIERVNVLQSEMVGAGSSALIVSAPQVDLDVGRAMIFIIIVVVLAICVGFLRPHWRAGRRLVTRRKLENRR